MIDTVTVDPGASADVGIRLQSAGEITSITIFIDFDPRAPVVDAGDGTPQCRLAEGIDADDTVFAYTPVGCTPGDDCRGVEIAVIDTLQPIPDNAAFVTCTIMVDADAGPGILPLPCISAGAMGPRDLDVDATCDNGNIVVTEPLATPTPTSTGLATTTTPPPAETRTLPPTSTPTRPLRVEEDDGCQTVAPSQANTGLMLLVPGATLIALRRRKRGRP